MGATGRAADWFRVARAELWQVAVHYLLHRGLAQWQMDEQASGRECPRPGAVLREADDRPRQRPTAPTQPVLGVKYSDADVTPLRMALEALRARSAALDANHSDLAGVVIGASVAADALISTYLQVMDDLADAMERAQDAEAKLAQFTSEHDAEHDACTYIARAVLADHERDHSVGWAICSYESCKYARELVP